jgi:hypothetical protein
LGKNKKMKTLTLLLTLLFQNAVFGGLHFEKEEHARFYLKQSQLVMTGAIEKIRPIAYFDESTGVYLGSTKAEARKSSPKAAFAVVTYAADIRIDDILFSHNKQIKERSKVSVVWSDLAAIVDDAGVGSGCPEITHAAQQSKKRLWFLARGTGVWTCLIDADPTKAELTKGVIESNLEETETAIEPDPFQKE